MAKMSTDDLLEAFKEMTRLELSDFVKQFEEPFDVKAAALEGAGATVTVKWPEGCVRRQKRCETRARITAGPGLVTSAPRASPRPRHARAATASGQEYCSTPPCCPLHITPHVASVTQA